MRHSFITLLSFLKNYGMSRPYKNIKPTKFKFNAFKRETIIRNSLLSGNMRLYGIIKIISIEDYNK